MQKGKWLSEETLQVSEQRSKRQRRKERYTQVNTEFQRIARREKKSILGEQCKEIEENNRMRKTRDISKKIGKLREYFM